MPLPKRWAPKDTHVAYAAQHRLDVTREAEKFRNHHELKGTLGKDWDAGFRNWLVRAVEYRDERGAPKAAAPFVPKPWEPSEARR